MKRKITGKALITMGLICFSSFVIPAVSFSWNQATHAYIADRLGARAGQDNLGEMWGSVAPDMFIYVFDPALCPGWINDQIQGTNAESSLKVWTAAGTDMEHALAYGFVSHNDEWGADHTAHEACRTCGQDDGYIIMKARQLLDVPLDPANPERTFGDAFAGLGVSPDEALLVAHGISEYAVDIRLGKEVAPLLGRKVATAARDEARRFQPLLVKAYAADYAAYCFGGDYSTAASVLTAAGKEHRKDMIYLGRAISQPEPVAVQLLAEQLVTVLPDLLDGPLPVSEEEAVEIMKTAIFASMALCDDYRAELEATIEIVGKNLRDHGVTNDPKSCGRKSHENGKRRD